MTLFEQLENGTSRPFVADGLPNHRTITSLLLPPIRAADMPWLGNTRVHIATGEGSISNVDT